jgi:hypothetical protein
LAILDVDLLREMFRNLEAFRALRESEGIDILRDGETEWSLDDIEYLYATGLSMLWPKQRLAIELFLVRNIKESEAAVMMGVSPTNPIATYATAGLGHIIDMIWEGSLPRFKPTMSTPVRRKR